MLKNNSPTAAERANIDAQPRLRVFKHGKRAGATIPLWLAAVLIAATFYFSYRATAWAQNEIMVLQGAGSRDYGAWFVQGGAATNAAVADNAVRVSGRDYSAACAGGACNQDVRVLDAASGAPGTVVVAGGGAALGTMGVAQLGGTYSPAVPTRCNMAASTSCPLTAFAAAGSCLRITCSVDSFYRAGAGAQVAVVTDNSVSAKVIERFCFTSTQDSLAFISASAGYCEASVVAVAP